jgi:hypothetical protein
LCIAIVLSVGIPNIVGKRRKKPKKSTLPNLEHPPESPTPDKKNASGLFLGTLSLVATLFIATLQWNGVEMKWAASIALYAVLIWVSISAFWRWAKIQQWSSRVRIIVGVLSIAVLTSIAGKGVITQYRRDQPISSTLVISSDVTGIQYPPGEKVGGFEWENHEDKDLRLYIENSEDETIQNLELTITLSGTWIRGMGQMSDVQGVEFHRPNVKLPPLRVRAGDGSSLSVSELVLEIFPKLGTRNGWRIFCPRLLGRATLQIVIAAPNDKNATGAPYMVKSNGSYELTPSKGSRVVKVDVNTRIVQ